MERQDLLSARSSEFARRGKVVSDGGSAGASDSGTDSAVYMNGSRSGPGSSSSSDQEQRPDDSHEEPVGPDSESFLHSVDGGATVASRKTSKGTAL
eukprot:scaffold136362_cov46-Prasinocladus_malaysianus.AAC.2